MLKRFLSFLAVVSLAAGIGVCVHSWFIGVASGLAGLVMITHYDAASCDDSTS